MAVKTLNSTDIQEIQDLLLDRSRTLEGDLAGLENEALGEAAERSGAASSAPGHPAELASDASGKDILYGHLESQSGELWEVRDALGRLEDGSFGLCDYCEEAIPIERFRAIPYTRLCVRCKSVEEGY